MVVPPPIRIHLRDSSLGRIEVIRKQFGELLSAEWPNGDRVTLQETMGVIPTWSLNLSQYAPVCLVQ